VQTSEVQDAQAGQGAKAKPDDDEEDDDEEDDQRQRGQPAEMAAATAANPLAALGVYEVRDDADFVRVPLGASFRDDTGEVRTKTYYPTCRPRKRITSETPRTAKELTKKQKEKMIKLKQKAKKKIVRYDKLL
jgi:hypothetical protein